MGSSSRIYDLVAGFSSVIKQSISESILRNISAGALSIGRAALGDQIVVSGANFLTNILLARYLTSTEYGTYTVAFGILLFINSIQLALINGPMLVLGASLDESQFRRYFNSFAVIQLVFAVSVSLLLVLASSIGGLLVPGTLIVSLLLPVGVITVAVQSQEYFRQAFFTRLVPIRALGIDLIRCGFQIIVLVVLYRIGILSARMTFWAIGIASAISAAEGFRRSPVLIDGISEWRKHLLENWSLGKWMLTYTLIRYALGQTYIFATAFVLGVSNTARLQACLVILGPIMMLTRGFLNTLTPFFSKKFSREGYASFSSTFVRVIILWALFFGSACFALALLASKILNVLYQQKYSGEVSLVRILAFGCFLSTLSQYTEMGVKAIQRPQLSVKAGLITLISTAVMIWPLLSRLRLMGAAVGWTAASGSVFGIHGILLLYESRKLKSQV
jgi:O-antigen/teichoic acid export membrane protein